MNPRYKASQKWTEFPPEFIEQMRSVFVQNFKEQLENHTPPRLLTISGRIYPKEILLRVGLNIKGELSHYNFEVSVDHLAEDDQLESLTQAEDDNSTEKRVFNRILLAVDTVASLMADYFNNTDEFELPYSWTEIDFDGQKVWVQHSKENPDLEAQANALLGLNDDSLIKNADDNRSEDALDATEEEFDQLVEEISPENQKKKKKEDLH